MKWKKVMAWGCTAVMAAALMTGCGAGNGENTGSSTYEEGIISTAEGDEAGSEVNEEDTTVTVKVTAVEGNTITASVGELSAQQMGGAPAGGMPGGASGEEAASGEMPGGAAGEGASGGGKPGGEMPNGEAPGGGQPGGEMPSGEAPGGGRPGGEMPNGEAPDDGQPGGEMPNGEAPSGGQPGGEMPNGEVPGGGRPGGEMPNGEVPGGRMPGGAEQNSETTESQPTDGSANTQSQLGDALPEGGQPGNAPDNGFGGAPGGSSFTETGDSLIFNLTDATEIIVEYLQGSGDGTADDIAVGAVLEITLDDDNNAEKVIVKNLNAGNGFGGSSEVTNGTAANTIEEDTRIADTTYTSEGDDENALRVDGAEVTLENITIEKTSGESSNTENGDFYGQNAGLLALNGAAVTIENAQVQTDTVNGNGVFSYGEGTTVKISDSVIRTTGRNSGGIQTTGGGTTIASNLDVETQGNSSAAIRSDRGGGTVEVDGGTYVTNGTGSPAIYCTADISVANATLTANASEGVVVEGKNSVTLTDCDVTADMDNTYNGDSEENIHCIMIYQSMSGDAAVGEASFSAEGGSITAKTGDMFYVTNTDCTISLKQVAFTMANDVFLRVEGNSSSRGWGTEGANGGDVVLKAQEQAIEGNILVDSISTLDFSMTEGTSFTGAVNPDGEGGLTAVTIDSTSVWTLTGDSYITSLEGDTSSINANGYHLYVNGEEVL